MEYKLRKNTCYAPDYVLNTVSQQPVDADITLPDYCPDIERILRCTLLPSVYAKSVSGGQLSCDGGALLRVLYIDSEKKNIRSFEHTVPWSAAFSLKETPERYIVPLSCKTEYINCRALSPRKLSLHGAFSLYAKVLCRRETAFFSAEEDTPLECRRKSLCVSSLCCLCEEQFSLTEDISLEDKPLAESILQSGVTLRNTQFTCIGGKLMLSSQGELSFMYLSDMEKGSLEHMTYVFEISRIVDCEGMDEDTVVDVSLCVESFDLSVLRDALSEGTLLTLDVKLSVSVLGYREEHRDIITDAYATDCAVELTKTPLSSLCCIEARSLSHTETIPVKVEGETVSHVLDIGVDGISAAALMTEKGASVRTKLSLCLLFKNADDEAVYVQRSAEFDFLSDIPLKERVESVHVSTDNLSYRIVDEKTVEIRMQLDYRLMTANTVSCAQIIAVSGKEDEIKKDDSSLILYFAEKGESIWDISKNFLTCEKDLREENRIDTDVIKEPMMLLIPVGSAQSAE